MPVFLRTTDFSVSGETFDLLYDETNDMLITSPQPEQSELYRYYESEDYISHTDSKASFLDKIYQLVKKYSIGRKLALIDSFCEKKGKMLDIGAGTGDFLLQAGLQGWDVSGVEPGEKAASIALAKGVKLMSSLDGIDPSEKFDVITMWHVLEHVPDLQQYISKVDSLLKEDGVLIVAVPNFRSWDANHYGKYWAAYDTPRHLWHFSRSSIKTLFAASKMNVIKILPMKYDSYYVSILSEKYRRGSTNLFRAFFNGLRSNISGRRSGEYSSLIYVIKKC